MIHAVIVPESLLRACSVTASFSITPVADTAVRANFSDHAAIKELASRLHNQPTIEAPNFTHDAGGVARVQMGLWLIVFPFLCLRFL